MIENTDKTTLTIDKLCFNQEKHRQIEYVERNVTYQCYFAPLELHPADGGTMAVISQLSTMCPFSQWILIFSNCILINYS